MSDYISKSALIKAIDEQVKSWGKQGIVPSLFSAIAIVQNQPTVDEKEIISKPIKQILSRLEEEIDDCEAYFESDEDYYLGKKAGLEISMTICNEESGV